MDMPATTVGVKVRIIRFQVEFILQLDMAYFEEGSLLKEKTNIEANFKPNFSQYP